MLPCMFSHNVYQTSVGPGDTKNQSTQNFWVGGGAMRRHSHRHLRINLIQNLQSCLGSDRDICLCKTSCSKAIDHFSSSPLRHTRQRSTSLRLRNCSNLALSRSTLLGLFTKDKNNARPNLANRTARTQSHPKPAH